LFEGRVIPAELTSPSHKGQSLASPSGCTLRVQQFINNKLIIKIKTQKSFVFLKYLLEFAVLSKVQYYR
jgi:hypothetical protein